MLLDRVNDPQRKIYLPLPRLLLLRGRPSSGVWKTELNGASKGHAEREPKPSFSALMTWPAVISPSISMLSPPLAVVSLCKNCHPSLSYIPSSPDSAPRHFQVATAPRRAEYIWI